MLNDLLTDRLNSLEKEMVGSVDWLEYLTELELRKETHYDDSSRD